MVFSRKQIADSDRSGPDAKGEKTSGSAAQAEAQQNGSPGGADDDLAGDLMRRVGTAIDDWSAANGLDALPRKVVFKQALSYLNALADTVESRPK